MLSDKELEEIRRKLLAEEEEPPVMAWQNIQQELKPAKRRRPLLWLLPLLLLLLIGAGIWYSQKDETEAQNKIAILDSKSEKPEADHIAAKPKVEKSKTEKKELFETGEIAINSLRQSEKLNQNSVLKQETKTLENSNQLRQITNNSTRKKEQAKRIIIVLNDGKEREKLIEKIAESSGKTSSQNNITLATAVSGNKPDSALKKEAQPVIAQIPVLKTSKSDSINMLPKGDSLLQVKPNATPEINKQRKTESWTLGELFAPRYAFRRISANTRDEILVTDLKETNRLNAARMGYEYGLTYSKALNNRLYLESALTVMELKENVEYSFTTGQLDTIAGQNTTFAPDGSVLVSAKYLTEDRKLKSSYRYGGIRLGATYYFGQKAQSRYNVTAAAGANLLLKGHTAQYINGTWTETFYFPSKDNLLEQSNYNLLLGLGYNTHLFRSFELMVMPTLNYFLGSTYLTREPIGLRPYSLGLTVQVKNIFYK